MSLLFYEIADAVKDLLIQDGASQRLIDEHRTCRNSLGAYLAENKSEFSEQQITLWLTKMKSSRSEYTVGRHRVAAYRILLYVETGSIHAENTIFGRPEYRYCDSNKPYVLLSQQFQSIFREYVAEGESRHGYNAMGEYRVPVSEFLLMLQNDGITSLSDIDITHISRICMFFDEKNRCDQTKRNSKRAVSDFLIHMCGDCLPWCYRYYASVIGQASDIPVLDQELLADFPRVDKPSLALEKSFEEFAAEMEKRRYLNGFYGSKKHVFIHFFLFLELNKIAFSKDSIELWISNIGKMVNPGQKTHFICWFYEFIKYGTIDVHNDFKQPDRIELLPDWSRKILVSFLKLKKKEGFATGSIGNFRSAGLSLFEYFEQIGINSCDEITPDILMKFHKNDRHMTIEGKNTRSSKVRKLLTFMAEEGLIPYSHALTISTVTAPVVSIPQVLTGEMIQALYEYRDTALTPLEYRNSAMIMLGLRMGFRASDVINLRFENIDWKNKVISIVQAKTGVPVALPINDRVNTEVCQATNMPPYLLFQKEKDMLQPLPSPHVIDSYREYDRRTKVQKDSLIVFRKSRYSVPPEYIGKTVHLKAFGDDLRIYFENRCIAEHKISDKRINYDKGHYLDLLRPLVRSDDLESFAEQNLRQFDSFL